MTEILFKDESYKIMGAIFDALQKKLVQDVEAQALFTLRWEVV